MAITEHGCVVGLCPLQPLTAVADVIVVEEMVRQHEGTYAHLE